MLENSAIVIVNFIKAGVSKDLEIPLDISANELCEALFQKYFPDRYGNMKKYHLRSERPIALLRGEKTLREYGLRDGSIINIV